MKKENNMQLTHVFGLQETNKENYYLDNKGRLLFLNKAGGDLFFEEIMLQEVIRPKNSILVK